MIDPKTGLPPRFLRTPDAARFLGISLRTLEKNRTYGTGPIYRKIGGRVVYALDDLQAWTAVATRMPTAFCRRRKRPTVSNHRLCDEASTLSRM